MGTEQGPEFYTGDKYMKPHIFARYEPVYRQAVALLPDRGICPRIIDLGCGVGHFYKIIRGRGYEDYLGIDFSEQMLKKAMVNAKSLKFYHGNLLEKSTQQFYSNESLFVLLETLEHIEDDLAILESIPIGSQVIFSVPSFDARSHVRQFKNTGAVIARYGHLLKFEKIMQLPWGKTNKVFMFRCKRI